MSKSKWRKVFGVALMLCGLAFLALWPYIHYTESILLMLGFMAIGYAVSDIGFKWLTEKKSTH